MRKLCIVMFAFFQLGMLQAQEVLTYEQFLVWVADYHPVVRQADITLDIGEQEVLMARGGFDPLLYGDLNEKHYNDIGYYNKKEAGVILPTMAGVEVKGLYEQNTGEYLNPERRVPNQGLIAVGASVNLGQGLMIDQRRRALRQAEIYRDASFSEQQLLLNDLYLDAAKAYWNWAAAYQDLEVMREALELATIRLNAIKNSYIFGDLPAIDTLEANTQMLNRKYRLQEKEMQFFELQQTLNVYLWAEDLRPINLLDSIVPQGLDQPMNLVYDMEMLNESLLRHPELLLVDYDLAFLDIDRRFRAEMLKPVAKINYNLLTQPMNGLEQPVTPFFENNYKWGVTLRMPLFLRRERGALAIVKSQIDMRARDRDMTVLNLKARMASELNNIQALIEQYSTFTENITGLRLLLEGEQTRFDMGESSLFLINAREVTLIEGRLILNDVAAKRNIALARLRYAAGLGFE